MTQTPINHIIFWKSAMRTFRCIYVNCFNDLKTITLEGNLETRQMTPFLSSTFYAPTVCNIHFYIWKSPKFIFMWSPLWSILVSKIPQFWAKATNSANPSYFSRKLIPWGYEKSILCFVPRVKPKNYSGSWTTIIKHERVTTSLHWTQVKLYIRLLEADTYCQVTKCDFRLSILKYFFLRKFEHL